jgi:hypothetical protein
LSQLRVEKLDILDAHDIQNATCMKGGRSVTDPGQVEGTR